MKYLHLLRSLIAVTILALSVSAPASADERETGDITVAHPIARPNLPERPMAVYMTLANGGATADRLIAVASPEFETVELHRTKESEGVMRMERIAEIEIPSGGEVALRPGGLHLMMFGAKRLYKPGDNFPVVLEFARAGKIQIAVKIGKPGHSTHSH